jgi:hypothetical protein
MRPSFLAFLVPAIALAWGCTRPSGAPASAMPPEEMPDQETWGAVLRLTDGGRLQAVLAAPYLARFDRPDSQIVRLGRDPEGADTAAVQATLYDDSGAPRARIRASSIRFDERARHFTATGDVQVRAPGGRGLDGQLVSWSEDDGRLRVPGAFRYVSPTERVSGVGLVASGDLSRYAFSRARGTLEVRE